MERLARGLAGADTRTGAVVNPPRSVILEFGPDLDGQPAGCADCCSPSRPERHCR
ncbi:hypothetical protein NKG94_05375 [Micromonospora sp. M12]